MTAAEARAILRQYGYPNVRKHLEAIDVALSELGPEATMQDIWKWAEDGENDDSKRDLTQIQGRKA